MDSTQAIGAGQANQTYYRRTGALTAATLCALGALAWRRLPSGTPLFRGVEVRHLVATGLGATGLALGASLWRKGRSVDPERAVAELREAVRALEEHPATKRLERLHQDVSYTAFIQFLLHEAKTDEQGRLTNGCFAGHDYVEIANAVVQAWEELTEEMEAAEPGSGEGNRQLIKVCREWLKSLPQQEQAEVAEDTLQNQMEKS